MTEIGSEVPELRFPEFSGEWEHAKAGEAFTSRRERGEPGLPIYSVTLDRGLVRRDSLERQFGADAADEANLRAMPDDLVYNMMRMWQGAVGRAIEECMVSPAYVVLMPTQRASSAFFDAWFKSHKMIYKLWAFSHGLTSDRLRLYFDDFAQIPLRLPTVPEQKKIVAFLGAVDEKINGLRRKRDLLIDYKRAAIQQLFCQKLRFKRNDGTAFPDWEERHLGDVLSEHGLKSAGTETVFSVSVHKGLVNQVEHLGRSFSAKETGHYNRVQPGDVVYTKSPTGDFPLGIVKQSKLSMDVIVSPLYGVFTPETKSLGSILDAYFASHVNVTNYLKPIVQKGAKNTINVTNTGFLNGVLKLPVDYDEQRKIASFLSTLELKVEITTTQVAQMEAFKKGLLQQMFV